MIKCERALVIFCHHIPRSCQRRGSDVALSLKEPLWYRQQRRGGARNGQLTPWAALQDVWTQGADPPQRSSSGPKVFAFSEQERP